MYVEINGVEYDIGQNLEYAQKNEDGAYQDKLKYRLARQNNMFLALIPALVRELTAIRQAINGLVTAYIWAADSNTILASDDDTILTFYAYSTDAIEDLQGRMSEAEENIQMLAGQSVLTYEED